MRTSMLAGVVPPARVALITAALGASCVSPTSLTITDDHYRQATAGAIGCPAEEIALSGQSNQVRVGEVLPAYRAQCRGRRFICTPSKNGATCAEELQPTPPRTP